MGLNLPLFVHAQDERVLRRIEVQADDRFDFLGKCGVAADLERAREVWLQPMPVPDASDAALTEPVATAIVRVLQCVECGGVSCVVFRTTARSCAVVIVRGRPARGASCAIAASPPATNRRRQRAIFSGVI